MKTSKNNLNVNLFSSFIFICVFLLSGCHQSYYSATNKNLKRFEGENKLQADALVELNDYVMLLEDIGTLGSTQSDMKLTYLNAQAMADEFDYIKSKIEFKAKMKRIVLPDELSEFHDDFLNQMKEMDPKEFELGYQELTLRKLYELQNILNANIEDPVNDFTKEICFNMQDEVKENIVRIKDQSNHNVSRNSDR